MDPRFKTANTILYCKQWEQTVAFYRDRLGLPVNFSNDWFVEFRLTDSSRISIADQTRASVKSCGGKGFTLALEVEDIDSVRADMEKSGLVPTDIRDHPWGARVFYFHDPEGHRIEIWQQLHPLS
ncbi:MAG: VOC family protein [Desulfobacterales bacterium]|nr:VOC family protein [Desulfobacterales bacterium]